jgi:hypothetical protein
MRDVVSRQQVPRLEFMPLAAKSKQWIDLAAGAEVNAVNRLSELAAARGATIAQKENA